MAKQNKFNLKQAEQKARKAMEAAVVDIGNTAKTFFVASFRKQGWDDKNVEPWKPRKKQDKRAGRAILVQTGDLRRSIIRDPANRAALSIKIHSDLDYAKIHNDGGVINKTATGGKILSFNSKGRFTKQKTEKQRARTSYQQKTSIGAHSITMPKRQFMGDSYNLNEQVKKVIVKRLDNVFK